MAIITISRGSYSKGREVAEQVARRLNYNTLSREIILEASKDFNISEVKLIRALHDAPSMLERFTFSREKFLAYIESALLEHFQKDNVVYHGLAGHFFVRNVSHVLKVRIIADLEERIRAEMEREGVSREKAIEMLNKDDGERRDWSVKLYGADPWDPGLYDLVIHIRKLTVENVVDLICQAAAYEQFKTTPESQKALDDLALAAKVRAALIEKYPDVAVSSRAASVVIFTKAFETSDPEIIEDISCMAQKVPGVENVEVQLTPATLV